MESYPQLKDLWLNWEKQEYQCDSCGTWFEGIECPYCGIPYLNGTEEDEASEGDNFI